ncbi:hypothetical protein [Jejuia spongiicola]|uniref:Lipoprotein n=1 Tax=Jejuia spongiicola TaxID=2942207 RepID=A0ABT0QHU9_9FLAO|nr:hypothetical protein [Jejuia spongiicola]MCL6296566.1 hypothetical protein [Jejuia spongiicola]
MNKHKLKNLFKIGILIFGISLLTNCQKQNDDLQETEQDNNSKYLLTRYKQKEFKDNTKLINKLSSLKEKTKKSNVSSKSKDNSSKIDLDLSEATYIEDLENDYHSYTFSIYNEEENFNIKNIVISLSEDGSYEAFIVTYYLTEEEKQIIDQGLYINLDDNMSIESLDIDQINMMSRGGSGGCTVFVTTEVNCSCHSDENHEEAACGHPDIVTQSYRIPSCHDGGGGSPVSSPFQPVVTSPTSTTDISAVISLKKYLILKKSERDWLNKNESIAIELNSFLVSNLSENAINEVKMRIAIEMLIDTDSKTLQYKENKGVFRNREALKHTHSAVDLSTGDVYYKLENGLHLLASANGSKINDDVKWTSDFPAEGYHYIYSEETEQYYEYRLPPADYPKADIDFLLKAFWSGVATTARYATPLEDIIILIDGKDFDGVEQNKAATAGFMIVGFIPGGKILKPISKGTGKVWKFVIKNGDKVFTRTVKELTKETLQHFDNYAEGAKDLLQEALRKGDILDDEIIIEVGQEIADLSAKKGSKLTWPEVKALFKRGNDFNDKARDIYKYNEVALKNGKRLDSYKPGQEIISRKATTLSNIKPETFKSYLQELINKYPKGAEINAPKFKGFFDNKVLDGDYFLEIPLSNKSFFENSTIFQQVLTQFNVDNNVLIRIKYLAE